MLLAMWRNQYLDKSIMLFGESDTRATFVKRPDHLDQTRLDPWSSFKAYRHPTTKAFQATCPALADCFSFSSSKITCYVLNKQRLPLHMGHDKFTDPRLAPIFQFKPIRKSARDNT
jgi:hypothetical protein